MTTITIDQSDEKTHDQTLSKRVHSVAPNDLFSHGSSTSNTQEFQSFTRLKPGSAIQFRPLYPTSNSSSDDNESKENEWLDGIFWKFVKISNDKDNHKHKSTLYFDDSNENNFSLKSSPNLSPKSASGMSSINGSSNHTRNTSVDSVGSGLSLHSAGSLVNPSMDNQMSNGSNGSWDSFGDMSEKEKQWGAVRAVCTRDRDARNSSVGYIVFELPLDLDYFRIAVVSVKLNETNTNGNKFDKISVPSMPTSTSATNVISGHEKYPKIINKQLTSWTVEDVQRWMKYACKMRQLSHFKRLEQRRIDGMKLVSCIFNHENNVHYRVFGTKSIQVLTGIIDRKLAAKICKMLDDLVSRQKEKIRMDSIPFESLYEYINDPMKAMIKHKDGLRMRRDSIERNSAERRKVKRTLSKMDTKLHQSVTSLVIYHDTKDSTSDIVDEKDLYTIESATDVDTDGDYHTDNDYHSDMDTTPPLPKTSKNKHKNKNKNKNGKGGKKKGKKKSVRFAVSVGDDDSDDSKGSNDNGRSPIISISMHVSRDSRNSISMSSNASINSLHSLPMDDKEYRADNDDIKEEDEGDDDDDDDDDDDNGDKMHKKRKRKKGSKKSRRRRPQTAGNVKSGVKKRGKHKGKKSKSKVEAKLKHNRSKTAKFRGGDNDGDKMSQKRRSRSRPPSRPRHRQFRTWTSVKDIFNEDFSGKAKQFAKKKHFLQDVGALTQEESPGVPNIDHDFENPEYMKEYEEFVIKEQNKKKGVHSSNVYDNDSAFYYSASRVRFDDSRLKNALTVTNWPEFQAKRRLLLKNSHSENDYDDENKKNKDLWKEAPPITYRGYEKWLKQVENEINRVEHTDDPNDSNERKARKSKSKSASKSRSKSRRNSKVGSSSNKSKGRSRRSKSTFAAKVSVQKSKVNNVSVVKKEDDTAVSQQD